MKIDMGSGVIFDDSSYIAHLAFVACVEELTGINSDKANFEYEADKMTINQLKEFYVDTCMKNIKKQYFHAL